MNLLHIPYRNLLICACAIVLSACVATDESSSIQVDSSPVGTSEIAIVESEQGVAEVVHPVEPVSIDLVAIPEDVAIAKPHFEDNLWIHTANQFMFEVPDNARLNAQKKWYLRHPSYMNRVSKRASPFLYYIVEEIERREMPLEIALLPIVESAFDPFAYSHGSAAGMWQFISGTAKRFGMRQTWWYDGRRDVIASTHGALDYLQYLHKYFDGNWLHALAAYNSGEGRVRNAIRKNKRAGKPTDFWSLDLPRETRAYVPKLLALADILSKHQSYDFNWPTIENAPVIEVVDISSQIDLAFAADLAGLTVKELSALNPGFSRWATDPDGPHHLVLPKQIAGNFGQALAKVDDTERLNWERHQIKSGDSLLKIAKQYHTTADIIKRINNLSSSVIRQGDFLLVPVALKQLDHYVFSDEQRLATLQNKSRKGHQITHMVKSGDTLWDLARKYNISTGKLAKWNGMAPKDMLHLGQKLVVWLDGDSDKLNSITRKLTYTVRNGDSLSRIANRFNVKISDLRKWNNLEGKKYLQPGQTLTVIVDVIEVAA